MGTMSVFENRIREIESHYLGRYIKDDAVFNKADHIVRELSLYCNKYSDIGANIYKIECRPGIEYVTIKFVIWYVSYQRGEPTVLASLIKLADAVEFENISKEVRGRGNVSFLGINFKLKGLWKEVKQHEQSKTDAS